MVHILEQVKTDSIENDNILIMTFKIVMRSLDIFNDRYRADYEDNTAENQLIHLLHNYDGLYINSKLLKIININYGESDKRDKFFYELQRLVYDITEDEAVAEFIYFDLQRQVFNTEISTSDIRKYRGVKLVKNGMCWINEDEGFFSDSDSDSDIDWECDSDSDYEC